MMAMVMLMLMLIVMVMVMVIAMFMINCDDRKPSVFTAVFFGAGAV